MAAPNSTNPSGANRGGSGGAGASNRGNAGGSAAGASASQGAGTDQGQAQSQGQGQGYATKVKEGISDLKDGAVQAGTQVKDQVKQKANEAVGQLQSKAAAVADDQKSKAAEYIGGVAGALREAGKKLNEGESHKPIAPYADQLAGQLEGFADYFRDRDLRELLRDTEDFGRRHPEVFIGGALLLGFALARFLKSSQASGGGAESADRGYRSYGRGAGSQGAGRDYDRYASSASAGSLEAGPTGVPTVGAGGASSTVRGPEGV